MIVVDASVIVTALVDDGPNGDATRARLVGERLAAPHLIDRCWELSDNLTIYDAAYLALAEMLDVALLTADTRLARAPASAAESSSWPERRWASTVRGVDEFRSEGLRGLACSTP